MLQKRLLKSSATSSKRLNRRARVTFDTVKAIAKKSLPVIVAILAILLLGSLFTVKRINCTLNREACPQSTQIVVNKLLGSNSLFINQKELLTYIKAVYPVDKMTVSYKAFNTLNIILTGTSPFLPVDVFLVGELPKLSMDLAPSTTDSAGWWSKPSGELESFVAANQGFGFNFWDNGSMTPVATTGSTISFIFSEKPSPEIVTSVYKMVKLVLKYLDVSEIYIVGHRSFLSRPDQPDIIIGVPFDEGSLAPALQSMSYLSTIKKDAKVIDLSFKNPIIR